MEIKTRNTNTLTPLAYRALLEHGVQDDSRNGPVLRIPEPVTICLTHPWERVNFHPVRNANPFFHLMEGFAMLAGINSASLLTHFAKSMAQFSDDGFTYNAFYGTRARTRWGDQFAAVIEELKRDPKSRQCVVQLWDPDDLRRQTKDKACNLCLLFRRVGPIVEMTSYNRSNDAVLGGVSGANIVHLSMFHEYVAARVGCLMGRWWHVSNNLHAYQNDQWARVSKLGTEGIVVPMDPYTAGEFRYSGALFLEGENPDKVIYDTMNRVLECIMAPGPTPELYPESAVRTDELHYLERLISTVFNSWQMHRRREINAALHRASAIPAPDWCVACEGWLRRRILVLGKGGAK